MSTDNQRIANTESLPREHFCPVCQLLINPYEALQSMCGHLYCKLCLSYAARTTRACPYDGYLVTETDAKPLVESNKMLPDTIGKTMVYCSYQRSGCAWVGSLADSLLHCSECAFGNSHVTCSWCGIDIAHRQWRGHIQVFHGAFNQASVAMATQASIAMATAQASIAMATTQASDQGHGVSAAMLTQGQWYQQPYQQYYQNYVGDYMQQQPMQRQSFAPQNQVIYVQARPAVYHVSQTHSQMQQPQPHVQSQSLAMQQPQPQVQSQSLAMHQPQPQVQSQSSAMHQPQPQVQSQSSAMHQPQPQVQSQNLAMHQPQPQVQSQNLAMHQPHDGFPSQANTIQDSLAQNQPHASWTGLNSQSNQTNQAGAPPNNMTGFHQDHFLEQVLKYGGASVPDSSDMNLLNQHTAAASTTDVVHNPMHHEGPSYNPHIAYHQEHQPILGFQPNMNHFSATAPQVGLGHAASSLPRIPKQVHWSPLGQDKVLNIYGNKDDEAVMEGFKSSLTSDSTNAVYNMSRAAEVTTIKFDHKLKRKLTEACIESVYGSNIVVEGGEIKSGPLGKQDQTLLDQDGLPDMSNLGKHFLMLAEKSRARSAQSLDRGFDERSSIRTDQEHEPGFELRHASRSPQPSIELGEGQFRRGPGSPISEHLGMPSHGYGPSGGSSALHRSEFKGLGNLQMGDKVIAADVTGPVDSNGLRLGDVGSQSRYTLQGYPGDGGSFPVKGDGDWAIKHVESLDFHSQTEEHQQKSMDMVFMIKHNEKKQKMSPSGSSQSGNQNKNEESRFKGPG